MVYWGAGLAVVLIILDEILGAKGAKFRTPVMPVAVGLYLSLSLGTTIFFGGILRAVVNKMRGNADESGSGVLGAAGLITGEALMRIGFAILILCGVNLRVGFSSNILGLVLLICIALWLMKIGKEKDSM